MKEKFERPREGVIPLSARFMCVKYDYIPNACLNSKGFKCIRVIELNNRLRDKAKKKGKK